MHRSTNGSRNRKNVRVGISIVNRAQHDCESGVRDDIAILEHSSRLAFFSVGYSQLNQKLV